ncbi:MAG: hypothetical protein ACYTG0_43910 [Planctomycetota bacterium]|jgi:hypothetical protein
MWPLALTLPLGVALVMLLVFFHPSTKAKGVPAKVAIGLAVGFGLCMLLTALIEVLDRAGLG